jgi:hypothetical protein
MARPVGNEFAVFMYYSLDLRRDSVNVVTNWQCRMGGTKSNEQLSTLRELYYHTETMIIANKT